MPSTETLQPYELVTRTACPVCGATRGEERFSLPWEEAPLEDYVTKFFFGRVDTLRLAGQDFVLDRCPCCTLVYQRYVPGAELLSAIHAHGDTGELDYVVRTRGLRTRQGYSNTIEQFLKYFDRHPGEIEVLDFGAGWGLWAQMAAAYGCRTATADLSPAKSERLTAMGLEGFPIDDLPAGRFHFINTEQVIEHVVEPGETVQKLAKALRPGGILRVSVPNGKHIEETLLAPDWSAQGRSRGSMRPVAPLDHLNCFNHRALLELGRIGGLRPFSYPLAQYLDPLERLRLAAGALLHVVHRPAGTLVFFRKP